MKICVLDLETVALKNKCPENILQVSLIVEDSNNLLPLEELPHFTCFVKHPIISGEAFALAMNANILDIISGRKPNTTGYPIHSEGNWLTPAHFFLDKHFGTKDKITVAGKNVGNFDIRFLYQSLQDRFDHRVLDVAPFFVDFSKDSHLPGLAKCKERAGIEGAVAHDARLDCLDVIKLLRTKY